MRHIQLSDGRWLRVLATRDVAKRLAISSSSVRRYVRDGLLRPVRFPTKNLRYTQEELARFEKEIFGVEPVSPPEFTPNNAEGAKQPVPALPARPRLPWQR